jgi:hypothetical protein
LPQLGAGWPVWTFNHLGMSKSPSIMLLRWEAQQLDQPLAKVRVCPCSEPLRALSPCFSLTCFSKQASELSAPPPPVQWGRNWLLKVWSDITWIPGPHVTATDPEYVCTTSDVLTSTLGLFSCTMKAENCWVVRC